MREIDGSEASSRFEEVLAWVEPGEEIIITRRGQAVDRLLLRPASVERDDARAAARAIRDMSRGITLGGLKLEDLSDDGSVRALSRIYRATTLLPGWPSCRSRSNPGFMLKP